MSRNPIELIRHGLVVSSQAMDPASPLADPHTLALLARAADLGGPAGFRVDGAEVVRLLRPATTKPIIGICKHQVPGTDTYITPSVADAVELVEAGADIVAAQATADSRAFESFAEVAKQVHSSGARVMADISTLEEAKAAWTEGADLIATTLAGYTTGSQGTPRPATNLLRRIRAAIDAPIVIEGGVWTQEDVRRSFTAGAWSVVVGSAVTAPDLITRHLVEAIPA